MPFFVAKLKQAILFRNGNSTILEVTINEKDFLKDLKLDQRGMSTLPWIIKLTKRENPSADFLEKQLDIFKETGSGILANSKNPVRWLGSGVILFLKTSAKDGYLVVNQRHKNYTWGGFFDGNGGFSSSIKDMLYPSKLALKELKEEMVIKSGRKRLKHSSIPSKEIPIKKSTVVIVHFKNKSYKTNNLKLIVDPDTGTIDFRQIRQIYINNLNNLTFVDGEKRFINKKDQTLQERPILIFSLEDVKEMFQAKKSIVPIKGFKNSVRIDETNLVKYRMTKYNLAPTLKLTLEDYFK